MPGGLFARLLMQCNASSALCCCLMLTEGPAAATDARTPVRESQYVLAYQAIWKNGIDKRLGKQAPTSGAIAVVPTQEFGGPALQTTMNRADDFSNVANGTPRAELSFAGLTKFFIGGDYEVQWSTMIPRDYDLDHQQVEIVTQIHQSSPQGSPPFALMLAGDSYQVDIRGPHAVRKFTFGDPRNDVGRIVYWVLRYQPDETGASSVTDLYKDGALVVQGRHIVNAYPNEVGAYLKIGVYKWDWKSRPSDVTVRTMYYGDIEVFSRTVARKESRDVTNR